MKFDVYRAMLENLISDTFPFSVFVPSVPVAPIVQSDVLLKKLQIMLLQHYERTSKIHLVLDNIQYL